MKRGTLPKMLVTLALAVGRASLPASRIWGRTRPCLELGKLGRSLALPVCLWLLGTTGWAQVNSGSTGADGAFTPTETNTVINMADHPTGIYHYTTVNIPAYVTVTFLPNPNNTPVVWLVQSNCTINGNVNVSGQSTTNTIGGIGGPGGWCGGNGGSNPTSGYGPGGGLYSTNANGGFGSYGAQAGYAYCGGAAPGQVYGNSFLIPLIGGSGGGGASGYGCNYSYFYAGGGGGGGGAFLIASSTTLTINGSITAGGGDGSYSGGGGSGGAIRLIATTLAGSGYITAHGAGNGHGRIRFDSVQNSFGGYLGSGAFTAGSQFILFPTPGQGAQLTVTSVGGIAVSPSPTGQIRTPDAILSAQQTTPVPVVVQCQNIPLNSTITVTVKPANGAGVSATGQNSTGSTASSTATVNVVMPRGGGIIYATATTAP